MLRCRRPNSARMGGLPSAHGTSASVARTGQSPAPFPHGARRADCLSRMFTIIVVIVGLVMFDCCLVASCPVCAYCTVLLLLARLHAMVAACSRLHETNDRPTTCKPESCAAKAPRTNACFCDTPSFSAPPDHSAGRLLRASNVSSITASAANPLLTRAQSRHLLLHAAGFLLSSIDRRPDKMPCQIRIVIQRRRRSVPDPAARLTDRSTPVLW